MPADPDGPHHDRTLSPTRVCELVVNLDDATPQVVASAQRALIEAGALDVWTTAIGMKKQRPGVMLSLLCEASQRDVMARRVIELTGSFGVRMRVWDRLVLERRFETVATGLGEARVKLGLLDGRCVVAAPEYESVAALARAAGVNVREAMEVAKAATTARYGAPSRDTVDLSDVAEPE